MLQAGKGLTAYQVDKKTGCVVGEGVEVIADTALNHGLAVAPGGGEIFVR